MARRGRGRVVAGLGVALLTVVGTAGCGHSRADHPATPTTATTAHRTGAGTPPGRPTPSAGPAATSFSNPVFAANFPDPGIILVGRLYYAYSTNSRVANVPVMTSPDLVTWTARGDAMPGLDSLWTTKNDTWAPEVIQVGTGFVLFYTAPDVGTGTQCVGRARSDSPLGPFVDNNDAALVCQNEKGGSIDPSPFRDVDGSLHLLWKNDGNCCGYEVDLWSQRLTPDGLDVVGRPEVLLARSRRWQGSLIEGPEMVVHGGVHWLFYAANDYASSHYAEGVARCRSAAGPCVDGAGPVLTSTAQAIGPGHAFVLTVPGGQTWLAFHAWAPGHVGGDRPGRELWLTRVRWTDDGPRPARPSVGRQPAPG